MKCKKYFLIAVIILFVSSCTAKNNLELKTKYSTQEINQVTEIGTKIGNVPPDFTVVTEDGKSVSLKDFAKQKKSVVIYFMATWCPYCREDYLELSKVYATYEKNVSILSIDLDLSEDLFLLKEYKKKYPVLQNTMFASGQPNILSDYGVTKTTTKYAVGKDGKIIFAGYGVFNEEQWKTLMDEMLK